MPERAWIIPADWERGDQWVGYCIEWPRSWEWQLMLKSLMFTLTMGRSWDRESGIIRDAQAIGWEIFERNHDLLDLCAGGDQNSPLIPQIVYVGCQTDDIREDNEMSNCNSPAPPIKIEGGILYYWFCCQWVQVGFVGTLASQESLPDEPLVPPDDPADPNPTYSACGKAKALVDFMAALTHAIWDARLSGPLSVGEVQGEMGYELNNKWLLYAIVKCWEFESLSGGWDSSPTGYNLYDSFEQAEILCKIASLFEDDAAGIADDEFFERLKWVYIEEMLFDLPRRFIWSYAFNAAGRGVLNNIVQAGATNTSAVCDCPEAPPQLFPNFGAGFAWSHIIDLREISLPSQLLTDGEGDHLTTGQGLWGDPGGSDDYTHIWATLNFDNHDGSGTLKKWGIVVVTRGDENWSANTAISLLTTGEVGGDAEIVAAMGNNPSQAGTWQINKAVNAVIAAGDSSMEFNLFAYHPPDTNPPAEIGNSIVLVAIAIAGDGTDPLTL